MEAWAVIKGSACCCCHFSCLDLNARSTSWSGNICRSRNVLAIHQKSRKHSALRVDSHKGHSMTHRHAKHKLVRAQKMTIFDRKWEFFNHSPSKAEKCGCRGRTFSYQYKAEYVVIVPLKPCRLRSDEHSKPNAVRKFRDHSRTLSKEEAVRLVHR